MKLTFYDVVTIAMIIDIGVMLLYGIAVVFDMLVYEHALLCFGIVDGVVIVLVYDRAFDCRC